MDGRKTSRPQRDAPRVTVPGEPGSQGRRVAGGAGVWRVAGTGCRPGSVETAAGLGGGNGRATGRARLASPSCAPTAVEVAEGSRWDPGRRVLA